MLIFLLVYYKFEKIISRLENLLIVYQFMKMQIDAAKCLNTSISNKIVKALEYPSLIINNELS